MIHYDGKKRIFKPDTPHTSYIIGVVDEENFIGHVYYGPKISDSDVGALMRRGEGKRRRRLQGERGRGARCERQYGGAAALCEA